MKLIVDCPYVCHKVRYGMRGVELTDDNKHVEIIFGFLKQLLMICNMFKGIDDYIFCWDSRKSLRRRVYPEYKANRRGDKTPEEQEFDRVTMPQFQEIRRYVLPSLGFVNNFIQTGIESDDIIASVIKYNPECDYLLITSDRDMYQLLNYKLRIYNLQSQVLIDEEKFRDMYGIKPTQWVAAKAIGGCLSDNVKGIKGVSDPAHSEKSLALAYLKGKMKKDGTIYKRITSKEGEKVVIRNMKLIGLPYHATRKIKLKRTTLWSRDFINTFEQYDFQSFLKQSQFRIWKETLGLF